jgi:hypothetical protein
MTKHSSPPQTKLIKKSLKSNVNRAASQSLKLKSIQLTLEPAIMSDCLLSLLCVFAFCASIRLFFLHQFYGRLDVVESFKFCLLLTPVDYQTGDFPPESFAYRLTE